MPALPSKYQYIPPKRRPRNRRAWNPHHGFVWVCSRPQLYSDGFVIVRGTPPPGGTVKKESRVRRNFRESGDIQAATPIGELEAPNMGITFVVFRIGAKRRPDRAFAFIAKDKLDFAAHGWGELSYYIAEPTKPLILKAKGRIVALVMPCWVGPDTREEAGRLLT